MKLEIYKEANKLWKQVSDSVVLDNLQFEVELQKKVLSVFQVGDYYYFILNLANSNMEFISKEVEHVLGYHSSQFNIELYLNKVHPDDQPYMLNFENKGVEFLRQLPLDKLMKYKARYDMRIQKSDGNYIRILHQAVVLQHDDKGNVLITMSVDTDITHLKKEGPPVLSFIGLEGEPSFIDVDVKQVFAPTKEMFTKREKEILLLMIDGKLNKEISSILNISYQTVETHRKNMVKKANVKNSSELIAQAIKKGWI